MAKTPMTDEERLELAAKLDKDLDDFIDALPKKKYEDGWPEENWQEEFDKHPFFMKQVPERGQEMHPLYEGLQQLKYDPLENTPEELALSYKEDGNFNYKHKNYRLAILSYTEGLKTKCDDKQLMSSLHNNRSACHFLLKNYRSSRLDCDAALKLQPNYKKAILRAANCCLETEHFDKGLQYCDDILEADKTNEDVLALRQKLVAGNKKKLRDARKKASNTSKSTKEDIEVLKAIISRNINVENTKDTLNLSKLEPNFPELANHRVFLDENSTLVWPVIFLYPEYKTMDFLQQFSENDEFMGHVYEIFEFKPDWDIQDSYRPDKINIYYENQRFKKVYNVKLGLKLRDVLSQEKFILRGGTPTFIILVRDSPAEKAFLKNY